MFQLSSCSFRHRWLVSIFFTIESRLYDSFNLVHVDNVFTGTKPGLSDKSNGGVIYRTADKTENAFCYFQ